MKISLAQLRVAQERTRIARDLHDGVGADLASAVWRLRTLEDGVVPPAPRQELAAIEQRISGAIADLRNVVLDLRDEPRTWQELMATLQGKCQELSHRTRVEFFVEGRLPETVLIPESSDVLLVVTELVRNAVQHAAPTRVTVTVTASAATEAATDGATNWRLLLSVADDGVGLPTDSWHESGGGLRNVQARVTDMRGTIRVQSSSRGTRVNVAMPVAVQMGAPAVAA